MTAFGKAVRLRLLVMLVLALVSGSIWVLRSIIAPPQDQPTNANAVVVFAGGRPNERIDAALRLMDQGIAPVLVVSEGNQEWSKGTNVERLCQSGSSGFEVICVLPTPDDTAGEAALFAEIAAQRGWSHVVVVTSEIHLSRAGRWLGRCFEGKVSRVASVSTQRGSVAREWLATIEGHVLERTCLGTHDGKISMVWSSP